MNKDETLKIDNKKTIEYSLEHPIKGICKSWGIWARKHPNIISPVIYFHKPKTISDEAWVRVMENIKFVLPLGIEND
jgi:hypothetical protein